MSTVRYEDVELGDDLPEHRPDVSLEKVSAFCDTARMRFGRFTDDEHARKEGLPVAIVPGIMSQALLASMIHTWAPGCEIRKLDTIFRAPILVGSAPICRGAITDTDDDARSIEINCTIVNEAGETRVVGTAIVAL